MSTNKSKIRLRNTSVVFLVGDIAATIPWYVGKLGFKANAFTATAAAAFCLLRRESIQWSRCAVSDVNAEWRIPIAE